MNFQRKSSIFRFLYADSHFFLNKNNLKKYYSYILGLYLGDGYVCKTSRTYKLRIALDIKYNDLNNYAKQSLQNIFPNNKTYILKIKNKKKDKYTMIELSIHNNIIPKLFPQFGNGKKHTRNIELNDWQLEILNIKYLMLGLFHSDGCYFYNNKTKKFNYQFTNLSKQLIDLYQNCLNDFKIKNFITKTIVNNSIKYNVVVSSKKDVSKLYKLLGNKNNLPKFLVAGAGLEPARSNDQ